MGCTLWAITDFAGFLHPPGANPTKVALASRSSFTPARSLVEVRAGGVVPAVDRVGVVGHEPVLLTDSTQGMAADITAGMVLRVSLSGFIEPCLPSPAERPPSGPGWAHEIKHDGFRMMVRDVNVSVRRARDTRDYETKVSTAGPSRATARQCPYRALARCTGRHQIQGKGRQG
jgi:hypothetical protein